MTEGVGMSEVRELAEKARYPNITRIRTHDSVPSGRLRLRVLTGLAVNRNDFADAKTIRRLYAEEFAKGQHWLRQRLKVRRGAKESAV